MKPHHELLNNEKLLEQEAVDDEYNYRSCVHGIELHAHKRMHNGGFAPMRRVAQRFGAHSCTPVRESMSFALWSEIGAFA